MHSMYSAKLFLRILRIVEFEQAQLMKHHAYTLCMLFPHKSFKHHPTFVMASNSVSSNFCNTIYAYHMYMNMLCICQLPRHLHARGIRLHLKIFCCVVWYKGRGNSAPTHCHSDAASVHLSITINIA